MKRGAWHQFGDRSQKLALEQMQLQEKAGIGVILSPRDLTRNNSVEYVAQYKDLGAEILADAQFYIPEWANDHLSTHEIAPFRQSVTALAGMNSERLSELTRALVTWNRDLRTSAVIAPAIIYEAGRPDIQDVNATLFEEARRAANDLAIPVYATVVLGNSVVGSDATLQEALSAATALDADGWYFSFEFREPRIPVSSASVRRFLETGLTLSCTGKPVMHAFAGPLSLFSRACGLTAVGIGHSQNVWQFSRERWQSSESSGGGGAAPPRLFCPKLWGTIVYEDEFALMSTGLRAEIYTASAFSGQVQLNRPFLPWDRWSANKHFVNVLCTEAARTLSADSIAAAVSEATTKLDRAIELHEKIAAEGIDLTDNTNAYQGSWRAALQDYYTGNQGQIDLFELLGSN